MQKYKIKLELRTLNKTILYIYLKFLQNLFLKLNIPINYLFLPTLKKKFTLLKSPHVYKKSREQFEFTRYNLIILIDFKLSFQFLKFLIINKPAEIKLLIKKKIT